MGRGSKRREVGPELIHTPLWGPQIPVCPSFPLLRDQIPSLRSVWTCRAEPTVPRMLSRRHATLSGLLLNRLDFRTKAHRARLGTVHFDFYSFWKWILLQNWQLKILNMLLSLVFICEPACCGLCMSMRRYKSLFCLLTSILCVFNTRAYFTFLKFYTAFAIGSLNKVYSSVCPTPVTQLI